MNDVGKNKELSRRWFEEVWNRRRVGAIDELFAADGVAHGLGEFGREPLPGPAHFKMFWEKFCGAFPDLRITVEEVIGEGDFTSVRFFLSRHPSGRSFGTNRHTETRASHRDYDDPLAQWTDC